MIFYSCQNEMHLLLLLLVVFLLVIVYIGACTWQLRQIMNTVYSYDGTKTTTSQGTHPLPFATYLRITLAMYRVGRFWIPYLQQPNISPT